MTVTNNYSLTLPTVGGDTNLWGGLLNNGVITVLDSILGGNLAVSMTSSNVPLTVSQFQNAAYTITGLLTGNLNLTIPLSPNSATVACAGNFTVDNQTTGAFTITVLTVASGSTGVVVPQGFKSFLYSDGTNVSFTDGQARSTLVTVAGNPNGVVSGVAGAANTVASLLLDRTNGIIYACTSTGTVWGGLAAGNFVPQGYLTLNSNATQVVLQSDAIAATTVYYSPFVGNIMPISNGTFFTLIPFTQLSLALTASQAASNLYDVFAFLDSGTLRIGTGPSWSAGGGSVTAGSCARGTGAGSTQISRLNGLFVNTVAITAINGASSYSVDASKATYLGTLFMDGTGGQVTCHRSVGQSRKFGVWNAYNNVTTALTVTDPTASWVNTSGVFRAINGNSANSFTVLCGLPQTMFEATYQQVSAQTANAFNYVGIGVNSTTTAAGFAGVSPFGLNGMASTVYNGLMPLGISTVTALEKIFNSNMSNSGTIAGCALIGTWNC